MEKIRFTHFVGALYVGLTLGGCASTQQRGQPVSDPEHAPASQRHDGPNAGAQLGAGCAYVALGMAMTTGPVGPFLGLAIAGTCLPVAVGVGVLHAAAPHLGLGASAVPDTGPIEIRQLSDAERSAFPQSWAGGCAWGSDCYSHPGANKGPVEMNRLTDAERSAFPQSWAGGCAWGSDCYSYQGPNKTSAEMRKLTYTERSAFPTRFQAGCATYGYC